MKLTPTFVTLLAAGLCSLPPGALAQSAKELEELRNELKALRAELNQLKAQQAQAPAASASAWNDRIDAVELKAKGCGGAGRHSRELPPAGQRNLDPRLRFCRGQPDQGLQGHGPLATTSPT